MLAVRRELTVSFLLCLRVPVKRGLSAEGGTGGSCTVISPCHPCLCVRGCLLGRLRCSFSLLPFLFPCIFKGACRVGCEEGVAYEEVGCEEGVGCEEEIVGLGSWK
ncbi:hypothetical protein B0T26DRAFT_495277 [Lasiosphaeria miniovina]|uniref:Uncharacterized protein n=1 Tax=Lasiosphaeria miniovina TaxID=1954250 RepID=A0AA39ZTM4_9PEZI|nr:uncharacterized protein B0T26DRAFT_495277 [Lasiosphaeria miniovina]KAK0703314.1 hypothetical protein B0T26DRAFT_495277 [Lasiosphaeria miniovina]